MRTTYIAALGFVAATALSASVAGAVTLTSGPAGAGIGIAVSPPAQDFNAGDPVSFTSFIDPNEGSVDFTFTALQDAEITGFSITGVGMISDFPKLSFALDNGVGGDSTFTVTPGTGVGFGGGFLDNFSMTAGETVTLTFTENSVLTGSLQLGATFETAAPIPVPAGVALMLTALGGLAVVRKTKARADA